jgi:hypothetical protein
VGSTLIKKDTLDEINIFLSPICFHFFHVFFLCCMTAVPGAHREVTAGAAIVSGLWRLAKMPKNYSVVHAQAKIKEDSDIEPSDWIIVVFLPTAVYLALIVAGIGFLLQRPWAFYTLAMSCLALLLGAARGAWDSLIWIAANLR